MKLFMLSIALVIIAQVFAFKPASVHSKSAINFRTSLHSQNVKVTNMENSKTTEIPPGSPLSLACARTELRLSFQCKQGSCGSCEVMLDGVKVRSCITKVPDKKAISLKKAPKR